MLWLENIFEHTVDIDRTISLEGIPCIGAASKPVEDMFGIEVERICFLWCVHVWTKLGGNATRSSTCTPKVSWLLSPCPVQICPIAIDQLETFPKFVL